MSNPSTYRKTALMLTALMVLMPMIQMIEAPTEIENIVEENTSARAVTGTLTDSFEQTNEGEASGWVQAEGLDNTASYSLAWSVEADSDSTTVTEGSQTLSTGVSNATIPINTASLADYETYCLNATLTSGSDTIDSSSTCLTIYPAVGIGGPELSVEIWGWDDGTAEAIIDIDNLAGVETYTLDWELLAGNEESIADSGSEDLTGQLSTIRSNSFTGLADDYHCLEVTLSLEGDEVADAWDCFTAVMAGIPEASAHIEDSDFGEMEVRALVWNLTSGDEYKIDITVEDTAFGIISLSEAYEFNATSPAWVQEVYFKQFISGEYQINLTVEDITNGGMVAEWNTTFTMESMPLGPPGASFEVMDVGDGRISATLDLWNLSTSSTYELVWNQTSDWVDGANGSLSWEAAAHNISFAAFNAGPMPKGVYHWVVQAYVDNYHMATFYPTVSVTSQSPWSPDVGMTAYDDGFGGADIGLYGWNLVAGEEYQLDWELASADGTPIEGDSVILVPTGPVHTEEIDITAIGKGEYLLTVSLSDAENWYSSAGNIFEITTDPPYVDTDGDGIPDITDQCETTPPGSTVDGNGCSASQGVWASAETVIDRASIDKALGIDVGDSGNYVIGGVTRESDGPSFEGFVDLGAYNDDTCAVHSNGSITCWGNENTLPFTYKDGEYVEVELARGVDVDSTSERAWTSAESNGDGQVKGMVSDSSGATYVAGMFSGTLSLGSHSLTASTSATSTGTQDGFVAKMTSSGTWEWAIKVSATAVNLNSIDIDSSENNLVITGSHIGDITYGSSILTGGAYYKAFVAKLGVDGTWVWMTNAGSGSAHSHSNDVTIDLDGNIYVTGTFSGTLSAGSVSTSSYGWSDIFVASLDENGNWLWANNAGAGDWYDHGYAVSVDDNGGVYVAGGASGGATFDLLSLTGHSKNADGFIAKADDSNGNWLWVKEYGSTANEHVSDMVTSNGITYMTGNFRGTTTLGSDTLISSGSSDIIVASIDSNGDWDWAVRAGTSGYTPDGGGAIDIDNSGNLYVTGGIWYGTSDFGNIQLTTNAKSAIFVASLDSSGKWLWADSGGGEGDADHGNAIAYNVDGTVNVGGVLIDWGPSAKFGDISVSIPALTGDARLLVAEYGFATVPATGVCAIDTSAELECWNLQQASWIVDPPSSGTFTQLDGGRHFCATASTGEAMCWGPEGNGQVNDVPTWTNITKTVAGAFHSCAQTTDRYVECWGSVGHNWVPSPSSSPYLDISVGNRLTCSIKLDKSIECLGKGLDGNGPISPPVGSFMSIQSSSHLDYDSGACAIDTDGGLSCWGGPDNILSTIILDDHIATQVKVGVSFVCIIDETGDVWCSNYKESNTCDTNHVSSWSPQGPRALCLHDGLTTINAGDIYHSPSGMHQNDMDFSLDADRLITGEEYRVTLTVDTDGVGGVDQMLGDDTFVAGTQASTSHTHAYDGNGNAGWADGCYDVLVTLADSGSQNGDSWYFTLEVGSAGCIATSGSIQQMSDWSKPVTGEATGTTLSTYDDGFIQYYDDSGTLLWSQLIVGNQNETVSSVAIDSEDNVIACGFFWGSADFGDGVQYHSTNFADGFIAKYTQSGTLLWIEKISSGSEFWGRDFDACNSVTVDSEDNIIIGGTYFTYNKPSTVGSMTAPYGISTTGFVARLDPDGTTEWISSHANFTHVRDVAVGSNGDIAIAGDFSRTIEIGGKSFTKSTSGPGAFVAKVDGTTGMLLWTDAVMGASWLYGTAVALTAMGEVYFSGQGYYLEFSDGDSVDPGNGHDVYVIKYTENGDMIWKRYFGSGANDGANDLVTDEEGGVLVVGTFGRWIHYGNGQSFGGPWGIGMDVYVARLGPNGDFSWFRNGGGTVSLWRFDGDVGTSMDLGPDGTLHVVGHHFYSASFGDHDIGTDQGRAGFHATMTFDTDGDGVHDSSDSCSGTIPAFVANADGCAPYQLDSDGDGIADNLDQCPGTPAGTTVNGLGCEPPTTDETPTCSWYTTTTLGQVETIGVPMLTRPEWVSLNYQRALLSEGVYDVGLHCVDPNGDEFSLELAGPVESVQGSGPDVWINLTHELMKGYESVIRFDYTWTQTNSQGSGYTQLVLIDPAMTTNATPRVSLWGGKVNQHWDVDDLEWKTDPDGTSGANIGALATCKKWYPDTAAVELMPHRAVITFWTAGNSAPYETIKPVWECVAADDPRVLSGALQSGEVVDASTGTILATILLTVAACGVGAIAVNNRKAGKAEFEDEDDEDEEEGENKDTFIK